MKKKYLYLLVTALLSTFTFANSLEEEVAVDIYKAEAIYTGEQGLALINKMLNQNYNVTQSEINRINNSNSYRISKLREYEELLGKMRAAIVIEAFGPNPNKKKLDILYSKISDVKKQKIAMWKTVKESIWDILKVKVEKVNTPETFREHMGNLRW